MNDNNNKVIIIGSGPAGLAAAIYAARGGLDPVVISGNEPGGQLMFTTDVENYPGFPDAIKGPNLMEGMRKQAERFGTKFIDAAVSSVDFVSKPFKVNLGDEETQTADAVIVATGSSAMWLGLESESRLKGKGVSACGTCDGFFFKGKNVVVVGGGEVAIEEALFLSKLTNSVKVIHRRDELRAARIMQQRAFNNTKISFVWNSVIDEILGETKVEGIRIRNLLSNDLSEIRCDAVFVAIGHKPNTDVFRGKLELDNMGYVKKYEESKTNIDGICVAGDVYDYTYRQAVTAAGSGCKAAIDVIKYFESRKEEQ
ncbi:MAG: thioredoxin-disulfide reductase [Candidatus Nitrosopolaris wilkensis]|nr:MAG: thioredoxin-disulfide reductase [Candidatus Nitrosopolaris wilkensis]